MIVHFGTFAQKSILDILSNEVIDVNVSCLKKSRKLIKILVGLKKLELNDKPGLLRYKILSM